MTNLRIVTVTAILLSAGMLIASITMGADPQLNIAHTVPHQINDKEFVLPFIGGWYIHDVENDAITLYDSNSESAVVIDVLPGIVQSSQIYEGMLYNARSNRAKISDPEFYELVENGTTFVIKDGITIIRFVVVDGPTKTILIEHHSKPNDRQAEASFNQLVRGFKVNK